MRQGEETKKNSFTPRNDRKLKKQLDRQLKKNRGPGRKAIAGRGPAWAIQAQQKRRKNGGGPSGKNLAATRKRVRGRHHQRTFKGHFQLWRPNYTSTKGRDRHKKTDAAEAPLHRPSRAPQRHQFNKDKKEVKNQLPTDPWLGSGLAEKLELTQKKEGSKRGRVRGLKLICYLVAMA